jgi:DNA repair protein RadC
MPSKRPPAGSSRPAPSHHQGETAGEPNGPNGPNGPGEPGGPGGLDGLNGSDEGALLDPGSWERWSGRDYLLIRDLPSSERPRERLARFGPAYLSDAELLAIIWRTGTSGNARESALDVAGRALARFGGLAGLARAAAAELTRLPGVGPVKAIEVRAALELGRRLSALEPEARPEVHSPRDVFHLVGSEMTRLDQEHLRVVLLNTKNRVLGVREVYRGTLNSSAVRVGELFREAIRESAASLIVVHNHPSGDPSPSPEDVRITADAVAAGLLLDIEVLDHVVIGQPDPDREAFVSLKERRLGFE